MPLLRKNNTIPELYLFLTEEYGLGAKKPAMMKRSENKYEDIPYNLLKKETDDFAFGLAALGLKREDKVAIISENRPEWVYSDMAILALGGIDIPIYPSLTADSIEFILNNSEAKGVIVSNKFQLNKVLKVKPRLKYLQFIILLNDKDIIQDTPSLYTFLEIQEMGRIFKINHPNYLKESIRLIKENDLCTIIYTSGTTGEPKGVMLTHRNILSNVEAALQAFPIGKDDMFLSFLPLCHIFERMAGYYTCLSSGATLAFAESIETVAQNMVEAKPTILTTVPRLFERMYSKIIKNVETQKASKQKIFYWAVETGKEYAKAKRTGNIPTLLAAKHKIAEKLVFKKLKEKTGGRLRFFVSGGAALSKELGEFFEAVGIYILEGYGLTESSPVISVNRVDDFKFGTIGKPLPNIEVKIAHDGEILAKGPSIMQGYYKNKKETEAVLKDGWLYTGDIGEFDTEGFLKITDRKKHLFKTSTGKYIAPTPIENLFTASKYIDQFMLIGDQKMFLSALIVPDFESLKEYADSRKIQYDQVENLLKKKEINDLFEKELSQFHKKLANYERVRKFTLLDKPFTLEAGEITPSLKIKRKIVEERYSDLIEAMYQSVGNTK
jgi:long-chain acyl-CoA synthetase